MALQPAALSRYTTSDADDGDQLYKSIRRGKVQTSRTLESEPEHIQTALQNSGPGS